MRGGRRGGREERKFIFEVKKGEKNKGEGRRARKRERRKERARWEEGKTTSHMDVVTILLTIM